MSEPPVQGIYPAHGALPHPGEAAAIADMPMYEALPPSRLIWTLASIVLLLVCLAIFIWTGIRGADFGVHWDEEGRQLAPVKRMIDTETLLPTEYLYPSFGLWLNLGVATPDLLGAIREVKDIPPEQGRRPGLHSTTSRRKLVKSRTLAALDQPTYLLRTRATYVVISALAVLWVYLTVLVWGGPPMQAVLAASLLGTSWEIGYHSRWVAADCVLVQFAALTILLSSLAAQRRNGAKWLVPAAIAAGLGAGTKYPGGALLLPVLIAAHAVRGRLPAGQTVIGAFTKIFVSFAVAFLVSTPGAVLQPTTFFSDVRFNYNYYKYVGHFGYTVSPGLGHGLRVLEYVGLVVFSPYTLFAVLFFLFSIIGAYIILHRTGLTALIVVAYPILCLGYMSTQKVMIVRNDLPAVPALAVLSSFGFAWLYQRLKATPVRIGLVGIILAGLIMNEAWLIWTSQTIVDRKADRFAKQAADYVRSNSDIKFYLTQKVRSILQPYGAGELPNVVADPTRSTMVLISAYEHNPWPPTNNCWPANDRGLSRGWCGPYEVNWDYYTSWVGNDRIVILDTARALKVGVIPGRSG